MTTAHVSCALSLCLLQQIRSSSRSSAWPALECCRVGQRPYLACWLVFELCLATFVHTLLRIATTRVATIRMHHATAVYLVK